MNDENNFNYSDDSSFVRTTSRKSSNGLGKTILVPFLSGVVGASLVVGTCFGVPAVKSKLLNAPTNNTSISQPSDGTSEKVVNIANYSETSIEVAEKVLPSVVGITVSYQVSTIFGGSSTGEATGSGIIISEDGYILTNNHVISSDRSSYYAIQEATGIKINLYGDETSYDATVIGTDSYTDLAVLKIDKTGLTPATLGNSDNVKVGEFVMAIGNPLGMNYSVTTGVVSAVNREVSSDGTVYQAIQTDAAINSGNSGGALVNANGEVIGINTMKFAGTGVEGIGFAIPISSTTKTIDQLIEFKTVKRPYIGISGTAVGDVDSQRYNIPKGVYVEGVEDKSPAAESGLKKGDIITKIEGKEISSVAELNRIKYNYNIGDTVKLTIYRDNKEQEISVKLIETPEQPEEKKSTIPETWNNSPRNQETTPNDGSSFFDFFFR